MALISFFPAKAAGAIGALECSESERRLMAQRSRKWACDLCKHDERMSVARLLAAADLRTGPAPAPRGEPALAISFAYDKATGEPHRARLPAAGNAILSRTDVRARGRELGGMRARARAGSLCAWHAGATGPVTGIAWHTCSTGPRNGIPSCVGLASTRSRRRSRIRSGGAGSCDKQSAPAERRRRCEPPPERCAAAPEAAS